MEIQNFKRLDGAFAVAEFSVYIPSIDFYIHRMKLCKAKSGKYFIQFTQYKSSTDPSGKPKFSPVCHIGTQRKSEFETYILKALEPHIQKMEASPSGVPMFSEVSAFSFA